VTFPLVMLQRFLLKNAGKYVTVKGRLVASGLYHWARGAGWRQPSSRYGSC
jgi:hypothetical protein